ncbi:hypothetical protein STCU_05305 [Strigomonas culicis]|uniref:Uncharacterized protein n=1 Tax=Strigomonas culicis TaxID=28005 RepID=S9UBF4_9TRYP|nr:hypothetical protein STCU_05305 [Strigomonas culicis]|eukprot:EPY28092.1 hypothetical protein STCU_05305 [Strigomonas culicis]
MNPPKVNLSRKHGFKETREEREEREKSEKAIKWNAKLDKEDVVKLEKELESLRRATFLTPQQKKRQRLVERLVTDLNRREGINKKNSTINDHDDVPDNSVSVSDYSDDETDTIPLEVFTAGQRSADVFVPRSVRIRKEIHLRKPVSVSTAELEEQKILQATRETSDMEDFLDSLM